ncbi:MAG: branched-chain amino acid ABC transporter permease, partial [Betaproteobacteria bacterium]|nr:branched-chain amino acid ABC transporter permease [Betaproteobacteria bacterium]
MSALNSRSSLGRDTLWALIALILLLAIPFVTSSRIALDFGIRLAAYGLL